MKINLLFAVGQHWTEITRDYWPFLENKLYSNLLLNYPMSVSGNIIDLLSKCSVSWTVIKRNDGHTCPSEQSIHVGEDTSTLLKYFTLKPIIYRHSTFSVNPAKRMITFHCWQKTPQNWFNKVYFNWSMNRANFISLDQGPFSLVVIKSDCG